MREKRTPNQVPRNKPTEAWRVERMVQPVPGHLGEDTRFSPWLVVAGVALVVIIGAILLFFAQFPSSEPASSAAPATSTRRVTIIRITATPQATATPTPPPTVAMIKYTIKKNDTLSTIARKFQVSVEAIRAANNLTDDTLRVGDVLNIPQTAGPPPPVSQVLDPAGTPGTAGPPTNTPRVFQTPTLIGLALTSTPTQATVLSTTPSATPGVFNYTVKAGDNLFSLADTYSTTIQSIMDLNKLSKQDLMVGQVLIIPVGVQPLSTRTPVASFTATAYSSPTITVTPQFAYDAPDLLIPFDGADFAHDAHVTLQWLSLGIKSDEYYVVHLRYIVNGVEQNTGIPIRADEGNSYTLATSPVDTGGATQFWWYVVVVRDRGCSAASPASAQPCAVSPVSETRTFNWR